MMMINQGNNSRRSDLALKGNQKGFTLVELLVGMVIGGLLSTFILGSYISISKMSRSEREVAVMQINQRGSIENLEAELRIAGFDPLSAPPGTFGITDVRRYSVTDLLTRPAVLATGEPALTLIYDNLLAPNGALDVTDTFVSFRLFREYASSPTSLAVDRLSGDLATFTREVLADNIEAIGFAYSFDLNGDGIVEMTPAPNSNVIWAIDSNDDNALDFNLDINDDGVISIADDTNFDNVLDATDPKSGGGGSLGIGVPLTAIRAVKIWMLARAESLTKDHDNNGDEYVVGRRLMSSMNGDFHRSLKVSQMVRTIECRNSP